MINIVSIAFWIEVHIYLTFEDKLNKANVILYVVKLTEFNIVTYSQKSDYDPLTILNGFKWPLVFNSYWNHCYWAVELCYF